MHTHTRCAFGAAAHRRLHQDDSRVQNRRWACGASVIGRGHREEVPGRPGLLEGPNRERANHRGLLGQGKIVLRWRRATARRRRRRRRAPPRRGPRDQGARQGGRPLRGGRHRRRCRGQGDRIRCAARRRARRRDGLPRARSSTSSSRRSGSTRSATRAPGAPTTGSTTASTSRSTTARKTHRRRRPSQAARRAPAPASTTVPTRGAACEIVRDVFKAPSDVLGLSAEELRKRSLKIVPWKTAWIGRVDVIPPASDERTALIDRGLVLRGLLTDEQIDEAHRIGDLWLEHRDTALHARAFGQATAEEAIANLRRQKAALKEKKKREAKEREERRVAAVAERKRTDIIFLGRGVSSRLVDRRAHVERLEELGLPILSTPADVAAALGLTIAELRWLAFHADASDKPHYVYFEVPKRSGGVRLLSSPMKKLAAAQRSDCQEHPRQARARGARARLRRRPVDGHQRDAAPRSRHRREPRSLRLLSDGELRARPRPVSEDGLFARRGDGARAPRHRAAAPARRLRRHLVLGRGR